MQSKIIKIEIKDTSEIVFYFEDKTKVMILGDPNTGTAKDISYTGGKTYDAAMFLKSLKAHRTESNFWWEIMEIVDNFKTLVYEG
jgi:hypothetical protein